jgi:menaquinone-dependent protoporphyrinogen oxidase
MSQRILVAYASRTGSTMGVAQAIGETLAQSGMQVDVRPMDEITDLSAYQAIVAGSAIRGRAWLPEAMQFMHKHQAPLSQKPFAAFLVCMTLAMPNAEKYRPAVADFLQPVRSLVRPVSEGLFAGMLDISKVSSLRDRLMFRLSVLLGVWSEGDHRDWDAIQSWAESLKPRLI